jgi:hypothetical protein
MVARGASCDLLDMASTARLQVTADRALGATWTYLVRDVLLVVAAVLAIRCVQLLTARSRSLFTDS